MRRVFVLLYLGVIAVIFVAWLIYGEVLDQRSSRDRARVYLEAHGGGARQVAWHLSSVPSQERRQLLERVREDFDYPVTMTNISDLPNAVQSQLKRHGHLAFWNEDPGPRIVANISDSEQVVCLGPFPDYTVFEIEGAFRGWMLVTAQRVESSDERKRAETLQQLQKEFPIAVSLELLAAVPDSASARLARGDRPVIYQKSDEDGAPLFAAIQLAETDQVLEFGPFPRFENFERKAATTTLALVLLPAALAIAVLLWPLSRQLRRVEETARTIADGELGARVRISRFGATGHLATAFNEMASRNETLLRSQRELLQAVSHELRTPLARIRFGIDLVDAAESDEERSARLEAIDQATEDLNELVGELLDFTRNETAAPKLRRQNIDASEFLETLLPPFAEVHQHLEFNVQPDEDSKQAPIYADEESLRRAMLNLLSNACRYASKKVTISIRADRSSTAIEIDDDGCGIAEDDRSRVLEPFVQADEGAREAQQGVGLGLAIVNRILTQHGGSIEILASPLGGCCIRTTWPLR